MTQAGNTIACSRNTSELTIMIPVAISLIGTGLRADSVPFLGWFGPRGVASIILAILVIEGEPPQPSVVQARAWECSPTQTDAADTTSPRLLSTPTGRQPPSPGR
jgi:hypothetical protein